MSRISEKTNIPIGLAVLVIGGGAIWVTKVSLVQDAHGKMIQVVKEVTESDLRSINKTLKEIEKQLSRIEGELKRIRR